MKFGHPWRSCLSRLYQCLTRNDSPKPADLIFVLAGRMERKHYGLELYRAGIAPRLLLSVGRFEVSKMSQLGLDSADELLAVRDRTPADERHFFLNIDASGTRITKPKLRRWNTYGEVLAFREFLEKEGTGRVVVVSTDVHLRRVALAFDKIFLRAHAEFLFCPVPARYMSWARENWWARPDSRQFVLKEALKLIGYRVILATPDLAIHRLMRLRP